MSEGVERVANCVPDDSGDAGGQSGRRERVF
jgi:hypothetical protein